MKKYDVIKLPLTNVGIMSVRLNESALEGWIVEQMFQHGQEAICVMSRDIPGNPTPIKKKAEVVDILSEMK